MADISKINIPNGSTTTTYDIKDAKTRFGVGDSFNIRYGLYAGSLTGSKKVITFWIPSARVIDSSNANDCTMSVSSFRIYMAGNTASISNTDGSWSFVVREHGIQATFTLKTALEYTDGVISVIFPTSASLTFKYTA